MEKNSPSQLSNNSHAKHQIFGDGIDHKNNVLRICWDWVIFKGFRYIGFLKIRITLTH